MLAALVDVLLDALMLLPNRAWRGVAVALGLLLPVGAVLSLILWLALWR